MTLYLLLGAFTIWMAVDAYRRQAESYWFIIILLFAPLGGLVYLFAVKLRAREPRESLPPPVNVAVSRGPSLMELEQRAHDSPSVVNLVAYADAALKAKQFSKAEQVYRKILQRDPENKEALHGLALALLDQDRSAEAVNYLSTLMDLDPRFRDYTAAIDYAEALWLESHHELALEVLEEVVRRSPRLPHQLLLANYLALNGDRQRARERLQHALEEYAESPPFVRKRDIEAAKAAENLLGELG